MRAKTPSYLQLAAWIRGKIDAGDYQPGHPIPSLQQLKGETGLAIETIRHAVRVLEAEGLVYAVSGRGTFVTARDQPKEAQ